MTLLLLLIARKEFPNPKLMELDVLSVFLALLVQMFLSWYLRWRPSLKYANWVPSTPGKVGERSKKLQWGIWNLFVNFGLCPKFFHPKS